MSASPIPATGTGWNAAIPDSGQPHGNDYNEHRETKLAVQIRNNKEHVAYSVASAGGEHKQGSAVDYYGDYSASAKGDSLPTMRPDGATALNSSDYGRKAWDTDSTFGGIEYVYTASGWVACSVAGKQDQTIQGVKTFGSLPLVPAASGIVRTEDPIATTWSADGKTMTGTSSKWKTAGESLVSPGDYVHVISGTNAAPGDYLVITVTSDTVMILNSAVGANPVSVNYTLTKSSVATTSPVASQNYVDVALAGVMTPSAFTGQESVTFPNGLISKRNYVPTTGNGQKTITFAVPFPNACTYTSYILVCSASDTIDWCIVGQPTKTGSVVYVNNQNHLVGFYWYAEGY